MTISFKERKFDEPSRKILRNICEGKGLDIGSADRPILEGIDTLDINRDYKPTYGCDMHNIPLPDETYDFLIASHVLEHTDRTIDVLKEWKRVLKKGGRIGISVPNGELCDPKDLGDGMMTHRTLFTKKLLELFLKHIGFKGVMVQEIKLDGVNKTEIVGLGVK